MSYYNSPPSPPPNTTHTRAHTLLYSPCQSVTRKINVMNMEQQLLLFMTLNLPNLKQPKGYFCFSLYLSLSLLLPSSSYSSFSQPPPFYPYLYGMCLLPLTRARITFPRADRERHNGAELSEEVSLLFPPPPPPPNNLTSQLPRSSRWRRLRPPDTSKGCVKVTVVSWPTVYLDFTFLRHLSSHANIYEFLIVEI